MQGNYCSLFFFSESLRVRCIHYETLCQNTSMCIPQAMGCSFFCVPRVQLSTSVELTLMSNFIQSPICLTVSFNWPHNDLQKWFPFWYRVQTRMRLQFVFMSLFEALLIVTLLQLIVFIAASSKSLDKNTSHCRVYFTYSLLFTGKPRLDSLESKPALILQKRFSHMRWKGWE